MPQTQKRDMIRIRCKAETKVAFKAFAAENSFKNLEEALVYLLRLAKEHEWARRREDIY